jgi:DNA repair protein RecO (recombination protein O)
MNDEVAMSGLAAKEPRPVAGTASTERERRGIHDEEPGYVLHMYPFKETSLVVEVFTRRLGRLGLVARGARRPRSSLRGMLMAFQPLTLSWSGKAELRTLHRAEWLAGHPQLGGLSLMCGFYLNELLLKLLAREDPHEGLYLAYDEALGALRGAHPPAWVLRRFEKKLLRELGYGMLLERDAAGDPIRHEATYIYQVERGPELATGVLAEDVVALSGKTLLDMAADDYRDPLTLQQSRALMRFVLNHYLGGQALHTRQLLREMQQL